MHNGFIDGFAAVKRDLVLAVDESLFPEIKGRPTPRSCSIWPSPSGWRTTAGCCRAGHRVRRGMRAGAGGQLPVPGHHRDHRRGEPVGVPLLQPGQVPVAVLHPRRPHAAPAVSRTGRSCARYRTIRGWWFRSRSVTCPEPGSRCPRPATGWSHREATSSCPSPPSPRTRPHGRSRPGPIKHPGAKALPAGRPAPDGPGAC